MEIIRGGEPPSFRTNRSWDRPDDDGISFDVPDEYLQRWGIDRESISKLRLLGLGTKAPLAQLTQAYADLFPRQGTKKWLEQSEKLFTDNLVLAFYALPEINANLHITAAEVPLIKLAIHEHINNYHNTLSPNFWMGLGLVLLKSLARTTSSQINDRTILEDLLKIVFACIENMTSTGRVEKNPGAKDLVAQKFIEDKLISLARISEHDPNLRKEISQVLKQISNPDAFLSWLESEVYPITEEHSSAFREAVEDHVFARDDDDEIEPIAEYAKNDRKIEAVVAELKQLTNPCANGPLSSQMAWDFPLNFLTNSIKEQQPNTVIINGNYDTEPIYLDANFNYLLSMLDSLARLGFKNWLFACQQPEIGWEEFHNYLTTYISSTELNNLVTEFFDPRQRMESFEDFATSELPDLAKKLSDSELAPVYVKFINKLKVLQLQHRANISFGLDDSSTNELADKAKTVLINYGRQLKPEAYFIRHMVARKIASMSDYEEYKADSCLDEIEDEELHYIDGSDLFKLALGRVTMETGFNSHDTVGVPCDNAAWRTCLKRIRKASGLPVLLFTDLLRSDALFISFVTNDDDDNDDEQELVPEPSPSGNLVYH